MLLLLLLGLGLSLLLHHMLLVGHIRMRRRSGRRARVERRVLALSLMLVR